MTRVQIYDPFRSHGIDELFRGFFAPVRREAAAAAPVRIDVSENENGYVVKAEVPGVKKEDIHVTIEGNQVSISAEVKRETEAKEGDRVLLAERHYGNVFRSFTLPVELDESSSEARFEAGVLELKLAKKPAIAGKRLSIQ